MRTLLCAGALALQAIGSASAQTYPSRPITMVVPFSAGGPTDTIARIMAERMRGALGQTVIDRERHRRRRHASVSAGSRARRPTATRSASGTGARMSSTARSTAALRRDRGLRAGRADRQQSATDRQRRTRVPAKDLKELIAWLKANPDKVSAGTAGAGSALACRGVYFQKLTGTSFQFVPYRGAGPAMQDIVAGPDRPDVRPGRRIRCRRCAAARSGPMRSRAKTRLAVGARHPDRGRGRPAGILHLGLARHVGAEGHAEGRRSRSSMPPCVESARRSGGAQRLAELGQDIPPREQQTPEALGAYQKAEIEKWWPIIKAANIKGE